MKYEDLYGTRAVDPRPAVRIIDRQYVHDAAKTFVPYLIDMVLLWTILVILSFVL